MFSTSVPAGRVCHRTHQALRAGEATCAWRQKQVHNTKAWLFFYSPRPCCHRRRLETGTSDGPRSSRERHAYFTTGTRCSRRQLHSSSRLFDRRQSRRGGGGVVSSPVCRFVALSPRVKWLLFLREHFFEHHIGIKSHSAQWHKCGNVPGGGIETWEQGSERDSKEGVKRKEKTKEFIFSWEKTENLAILLLGTRREMSLNKPAGFK